MLAKHLISNRSETRFLQWCNAWKESKYGIISGPYFPVFGLNTVSAFSTNTGKYGQEITPYLDNFHAVSLDYYLSIFKLIHIYIYTYKNLVLRHICFYLDVMTLMTKSPKKPVVSWIVCLKSILYLYYEHLFQIHDIALSEHKRDSLKGKH